MVRFGRTAASLCTLPMADPMSYLFPVCLSLNTPFQALLADAFCALLGGPGSSLAFVNTRSYSAIPPQRLSAMGRLRSAAATSSGRLGIAALVYAASSGGFW